MSVIIRYQNIINADLAKAFHRNVIIAKYNWKRKIYWQRLEGITPN